MESHGFEQRDPGAGAQPGAADLPKVEPMAETTVIAVERSGGDWMPVEELREAALEALAAGRDITIQLSGIDFLDAASLQILLALDREQKQTGRRLALVDASPNLRQWFEYAGAAEQFFEDGVTA